MDFQADSIQGVLFLAPGQRQEDALKLWGELFPNDSPDGFQRFNNSPALNSSAHGDRQGFQINVNAQVGRIDVILAHSPQALPSDAGPPRIADVPAATAKVVELLKRLAANLKVIRTAVVLELAKTVARGGEAVEILNNLPGYPLPENVTDVNIQFNSRKSFAFDAEREMNRLCAWSSGQVGFIMNPQLQGRNLMMMTPFVGLKIDVNSVPQTPLSADVINQALDELAAEAVAIAAEGVARFQA
jgi:hypothetical protein